MHKEFHYLLPTVCMVALVLGLSICWYLGNVVCKITIALTHNLIMYGEVLVWDTMGLIGMGHYGKVSDRLIGMGHHGAYRYGTPWGL